MCSASEAASTDGDATREDLKRDILLAHTLSLLTQQQASVPAHALPALAAYLTERGVMPRWVQVGIWSALRKLPLWKHCTALHTWLLSFLDSLLKNSVLEALLHRTSSSVPSNSWGAGRRISLSWSMQVILTQQPALFDRAFQKLFSEEIAEAEEGASRRALAADKQEPAAWVLQRFWERHAVPAPSLAAKPVLAPAATQGLSRYEIDFQVGQLRPKLQADGINVLGQVEQENVQRPSVASGTACPF